MTITVRALFFLFLFSWHAASILLVVFVLVSLLTVYPAFGAFSIVIPRARSRILPSVINSDL